MDVDIVSALVARFNAGELTVAEYVQLVEVECDERFPRPQPPITTG